MREKARTTTAGNLGLSGSRAWVGNPLVWVPAKFPQRKENTMVNRMLPLCLAILALILFVGAPALAEDKAALEHHDGKVVSVTGNKLVMADQNGKEHTHNVAADAKIMLDSKECKLADIKPGMRIRVFTAKDNLETALKLEALDKEKTFPKN
jgi:hypothetical protein